MADKSIQTPRHVPDITYLFCGVPWEIHRKSYPEHASPLTKKEIEKLEQLDTAASNAHSYACMGLDVIERALCKAEDDGDTNTLNSTSALTSLLADILHHANDTMAIAQHCLLEHYKRLVENDAREYVEVPVVSNIRDRGARKVRP